MKRQRKFVSLNTCKLVGRTTLARRANQIHLEDHQPLSLNPRQLFHPLRERVQARNFPWIENKKYISREVRTPSST